MFLRNITYAMFLASLMACGSANPQDAAAAADKEAQRVADSIKDDYYRRERAVLLEEKRIADSITGTRSKSKNTAKKETQSKPSKSITMLSNGNYGTKLRARLNYLMELDEVQWVEVDDNSVYIGINTLADLKLICNAAAYVGNKDIGFGVHVYAIDARKHSNSASSKHTYVYNVTYRNGKKQ